MKDKDHTIVLPFPVYTGKPSDGWVKQFLAEMENCKSLINTLRDKFPYNNTKVKCKIDGIAFESRRRVERAKLVVGALTEVFDKDPTILCRSKCPRPDGCCCDGEDNRLWAYAFGYKGMAHICLSVFLGGYYDSLSYYDSLKGLVFFTPLKVKWASIKLGTVKGMCPFLSTKGCIIPRLFRPRGCQGYSCCELSQSRSDTAALAMTTVKESPFEERCAKTYEEIQSLLSK